MGITLMRVDGREFEKLADQTKLGRDAREMARLVLVEGRSAPEVASIYGMTKQRVRSAVESIRRVHQHSTTRSGWVSLQMEVPERLSIQLSEMLAALKAAESRDAKALALSQVEHALQRARQTLVESLAPPGGPL